MLKVLPLMKKRGKGTIINLASRAGSRDFPSGFAYAVTKSAVIRATGCAQLQLDAEGLGEDIQIYCLHPGGVLTDMPQSMTI
jgi:NAD(P)-dependent dehydrogenase (short-subunit alcohol dehydrogenase family)